MTPQKVLISTCFWPLRHISLKQRARPATTLLNTSKKLDVLSIPWVYPSIESSFKFGEVPSFQWLFVQSFWAFSCSKYSTFAWRCLRQVKSIVDGNQKILRRFTSWGKGSWNPIIYKGFRNIPGGWEWDFWTINSMLLQNVWASWKRVNPWNSETPPLSTRKYTFYRIYVESTFFWRYNLDHHTPTFWKKTNVGTTPGFHGRSPNQVQD